MEKVLLNIDGVEVEVAYHLDEAQSFEHCDFMPIKIGSVKRTDEGYLKGEAAIAKVGVLKYWNADGTTRSEFVPSETLFNADSMDSMKLQPITDRHPEEVLIDSKSVKRRKVGATGEKVCQDSSNKDFLICSVAIHDAEAIESVDKGRLELSPGYKTLVVKKDGVYKGEKYDYIQIKRTYNHLALCDKARGGSDLRLNIDSLTVEELSKIDGFNIPQSKEIKMPKLRIKNIEYDAAQEVINHVDELTQKIQGLEDAAKEKDSSVTKLQAKNDELSEENKTLKARDIQSEINAGVAKKLSILKIANDCIKDEEVLSKIDSMSEMDIKKEIILAKYPTAKLEGKNDEYINARVDSIVEAGEFDPEAIDAQRAGSAKKQVNKDGVDSVEKARVDSEKALKDSYKNFGK